MLTASHHDKWLCARLLIPLSLVDSFPQRERHKFRTMVGGVGMNCPWRTILCGLGGGVSMGSLLPMLASVSDSLLPCMSL